MLTTPAYPGLPSVEDLFAPAADMPALGVAVSGGPDSMALMALAAEWALRHDKRIVIYTVDHQLRPEAAAECAMVAREAATLGLEARVLVWRQTKPAAGLQAAARKARYRLIGAAMRADGIGVLATAHHRDDQAETVLMRLAHGSGIEGLSGMRRMAEVEGITIFRPLIEVSRAALAEFVAHKPLTPVADPSNADSQYERVRWRSLMPAFAEQGLDAARLARFATRAARADAALAEQAALAFGRMARFGRFGEITVSCKDWSALPEEIGLRVLRAALDWAGGSTASADLGQIEALAARLMSGDEPVQATLGGAQVAGNAEGILIWREAGRIGLEPGIVGPEDTVVWDRRFAISNPTRAPLRIAPALEMTREAAEEIVGQKISAPMAMVRATPLVTALDGRIAALGCHCVHSGIKMRLTNRIDGGPPGAQLSADH